jgi:hypothetical protein
MMDTTDDYSAETFYYDPTMVIEFRQLESQDATCQIEDMRIFLIYDETDDLIYAYGSRKSNAYPNLVDFVKCFECEDSLYDFLNIMMGFDKGYSVNTSVYYMSGLTNQSYFDDFVENTSKKNEITGYDREKMSRRKFHKYMSVLY